MSKYALIKDYKIDKIQELTEEEYLSLSYNYQNIIDITDEQITPQLGWIFNGIKFIAPAPVDPITYVSESVIPAAKAFSKKLEKEFIAENILMGITQYNKTGAVLGVFSKKINIAGSSNPVSLMDTLQSECPSLTASIEVLTYLIDNSEEYEGLSPFLTTDRLTSIKNKIIAFLTGG